MPTRLSRRQVLAVLGSLGLAGCSQGDPRSTETATNAPPSSAPTETIGTETPFSAADVHVITDYSSEAWQDAWKDEFAAGFEEQTGAAVVVEHTMSGTRRRVERLVESGDPPELYHGTLTEVSDFVAAGRTVPVGDLVSDIADANGELRKPRSVRTRGGVQIVPHGLTLGRLLNYRVDVYDELGLSVPETWDDLLANARAIDESEAFDVRGFAIPADRPRAVNKQFANWLYNAGGDFWRWSDEGRSEVEVDFRPEHVRAVLEVMRNLLEYSPDPSKYLFTHVFRDWITGRIGQCLMNNAWLCGPAYRNGAREIALDTRQALVPKIERRLDPIDRGWIAMDGTPLFADASVTRARDFLRYLYEGPERQARMHRFDPMRWLPPYDGVMDTDAYRSAEIFQVEDGHLLDVNRHCGDEFAPHLGGDRPRTTASLYASRFPIAGEMVQAVLVEGKPIDDEIERARGRLAARLQEGQELVAG